MPPFLRNSGRGWVTAEYGMLPRATAHAHRARGGARQAERPHAGDPAPDRPLAARRHRPAGARRAADQDRLRRAAGRRRHAHGRDHRRLGRAASGLPAPHVRAGRIARVPLNDQVAAVSCGIYKGAPLLDLDYAEDIAAEADANFVLTGEGGIVEVQGTAERGAFSEEAVPGAAGACPKRHRRAGRAAARRRSGSAERWHAASPAAASSSPPTIPASCARSPTLLQPYGVDDVVAAGTLGLPEPEETGDDLRRQRRAQGARGGRSAAACRRWPTIPGLSSPRWAARRASIRRAGPVRQRDFDVGDGARRARSSTRGRAIRTAAPLRLRAGACLAGRPRRDLRGQGRTATLVWPPRGDARLRLRPDLRARRRRRHLRRDGPGREARHQPPRPRLRQAGRGLL